MSLCPTAQATYLLATKKDAPMSLEKGSKQLFSSLPSPLPLCAKCGPWPSNGTSETGRKAGLSQDLHFNTLPRQLTGTFIWRSTSLRSPHGHLNVGGQGQGPGIKTQRASARRTRYAVGETNWSDRNWIFAGSSLLPSPTGHCSRTQRQCAVSWFCGPRDTGGRALGLSCSRVDALAGAPPAGTRAQEGQPPSPAWMLWALSP